MSLIKQIRELRLEGKFAEALQAIEIAPDKEKEIWSVLQEQANIQRSLKDFPGAIKTLQTIAANFPDKRIYAADLMARLQVKLGLLPEARESFAHCLKLAEESAEPVQRSFYVEYMDLLDDLGEKEAAWKLGAAATLLFPHAQSVTVRAANLAVKAGHCHEAQEIIVRGLATEDKSDPIKISQVLALCEALRSAGDGQEAMTLAEASRQYWPHSSFLAVFLATVAEQQEDSAQEIEFLRQAVQMEDVRGTVVYRYAKCLRKADFPRAEVEEAYGNAIIANPEDKVVLDEFVGDIRKTHGAKTIADRLVALQQRTLLPLRNLMLYLIETKDDLFVRKHFAPQIEAFTRTDVFRDCDAVWTDHYEYRPLDRDACARVVKYSSSDIQLYFLLKQPRRREIEIKAASDEEAELLAALGIELPRLQEHLKAHLEPGSPEWEKVLTDAVYASKASFRTVGIRESYTGFQDRAVASQVFNFMDPFTGAECAAIDSYWMFGRPIFTFKGRNLFYAICGGAGSKLLGLYLPKQELILSFGGSIRKALTFNAIATAMGACLDRICRNVDLFEKAVQNPPAPTYKRKVVVTMFAAENFAHHLWNVYTGLEKQMVAGNEDNISEVIFSGTEFFGPVAELFPEIPAEKFKTVPRTPIRDPHPFSGEHLVMPVGGYFIPISLLNRVERAMLKRPAASAEHLSPSLTIKEEYAPIIWIGLRLGDKSWENQEEEVPRMMDRIFETHPNVLFLLDGFSFPVGVDSISAIWRPVIDKLSALAARMRRASSHPERVISMIGNTLRENVLWARKVDAYVTPIGTTQHKVGWFTSSPGMIYVGSGWKDIPPESRPGSWEAEGILLPMHVEGDVIISDNRKNVNDNRTRLENIILDGKVVAERLLTMMEQAKERREQAEETDIASRTLEDYSDEMEA